MNDAAPLLSRAERSRALDGLRVLDFTGHYGAYCGRLLAGLGADVLRIEPPGGGELRRRGPFLDGLANSESSLNFQYLDSGKRSLVLDPTSARDRARLLELSASADIVLDSWSSADPAGLELGKELVRKNPRLIHTSITPFGRTGPNSARPAPHLITVARSGLLSLSGMPESPPSVIGAYQGEIHAGLVAAAGTLTALRSRQLDGAGRDVDVSAQEALIFATSNALDYFDLLNVDLGRLGIRNHAGLDMYYRAEDRWMVFWLGGRWDALLEWAEESGIDTRPFQGEAWQERAFREKHPKEIRAMLETLFSSLGPDEIYREGERRRLVTAPVNTMADVAHDAQLASRDFWVDTELTAFDRPVRFPGAPFKMQATPWRAAPAPVLGSAAGTGWQGSAGREFWETVSSAGTSAAPADDRLPLAGIRVIDLGGSVAVPFATKIMADFGADVVRIETLTRIDGMRVSLPQPADNPGPDSNGTFNIYNTSKRSILLDLNTAEGRELFLKLVALSDVLVDNFGVDPYPKWGMSEGALFELNPDLILARSSFMGRSGPDQNYVGLGYCSGALAGLHSLTGFPEDPPVSTCTAHSDFSSNPFHILVSILSALSHRDRTGVGQVIDLSQHESTISLLGPPLLDFLANGRVAGRNANRVPDMAPHGVYRSAGEDAWVAVAAQSDEAWQALFVAIGEPAELSELRQATLARRLAEAARIDAAITRWASERTPESAAELLSKAGVAASPVLSMRELVADEHLKARGFFRKLPHPVLGDRWHYGAPYRISGAPNGPCVSAPLVGAHTEDILTGLLGLSEDELTAAYLCEAIG